MKFNIHHLQDPFQPAGQGDQGYIRDPKEAFKDAIAQGRLSTDPAAKNYAGHYMYMGPGCGKMAGKDAFKNKTTRAYDV